MVTISSGTKVKTDSNKAKKSSSGSRRTSKKTSKESD